MDIKIGDFVKLKDWDVFLEVLAVDYDTNSIRIARRTTDEIYTAWYSISQGFIKQEEDKMEKQDDFQVGDVVWCVISGKGEVKAIFSDGRKYPLYVVFDSGDYNDYTLDGKYLEKGNRLLFFSEPKVEGAVTRPFVSTLVGKKVVVLPKHKDCTTEVMTVSDENEEKIYLAEREGHYWKKEDLAAIYEVQPGNLLKK